MTTIERIRVRKLTGPAYSARGEIVRDGMTGPEYVGDLWGRVEFSHFQTDRRRVFRVAVSDKGPLAFCGGGAVSVVLSPDIRRAREQARKILRKAMELAPRVPADVRAALTAYAAQLRTGTV